MIDVRFFPCLLLVLVAACSPSAAPDLGSSDLEFAWVEQHFHNGDGGNFSGPTPPETSALLRNAGVDVFEISVEHVARCMGPGCPTYSARHFAMISAVDSERAAELGFLKSAGPGQ